MHGWLLDVIRCPLCGGKLAAKLGSGRAPAGVLVCKKCKAPMPVLALELPGGVRAGSESPEVAWAAEVLPPTGEGPGYVQRVTAVLRGAVQVELAPDPAPGQYRVNLYRFEGQRPERVARYGLRIGLSEEVPAETLVPPR
jgi:hypothetical protein